MKKWVVFLMLAFLPWLLCGQTEKAATLGTSNFEWFDNSCQTLDGGCLLGGIQYGYSYYYDHAKGLVVKLDSTGLTEWIYRLEHTDNGDIFIEAVSQGQDGSYFVLFELYKDTYPYYPSTGLVKLDGSGNQLWHRTYSTGAYSYPADITLTTDGGALIIGVTNRSQWVPWGAWRNSDEMLMFKVDGNGEIDWQGRYGQFQSNAVDNANRVIQTGDGGYLVVGHTSYHGIYNYDDGQNSYDVLVMKLDSRGSILWQRTFGTDKYEFGLDVVETGDGGFLVVAQTEVRYDYSSSRPRGQAWGDGNWLIRIDAIGNIVWQRNFGYELYNRFYSATRLDTGGYLVSGNVSVPGLGEIQGRIMKIDDSGRVQWQKTYGGSDEENIVGVYPLNDRLLMAVGSTDSFGEGWGDGLVMILSNEGEISSSCTDRGFLIQDLADNSVETTVSGFESKLRRKESAVQLSNQLLTISAINLNESLICERIKKLD